MIRRTTLTEALLLQLNIVPDELEWESYSPHSHAYAESIHAVAPAGNMMLLKELLRRHENDKAMMMKRIAQLETYVAQLELMPSDQTWAQATDAVGSEINAIKYRTD